MITHRIKQQTQLKVNEHYVGETIEKKIERMISNKEPLTGDGAPPIYTERKDGVIPAYNIRTDRFEIAIEAGDKIAGSYRARREETGKVIDLNSKREEGIQATDSQNQ